jgi:hypothetical protein
VSFACEIPYAARVLRRGASEWAAEVHLNADRSLSDALREIERRDQAGFFRVVQAQRQVWAEKLNGKLRLRKWHAGSPRSACPDR